jgi:hypothetical protein
MGWFVRGLGVTAQDNTPTRFVCCSSFVHHHMHQASYHPQDFIKIKIIFK